jgi:hypothetical protein
MKPNDTLDYQNILRAIGQGIEKLGVESFDLEISDNQDFVVSGIYRDTKGASEPKAVLKKSFLSQIFNAAKGNYRRITGTALFHFSGIRFTPSNIELLDRAGKASRSSWGGRPMKSPLSISYVLRTAGSFLDSNGSRFVRLSWRYNVLTLWHIQDTGVEAKEIFSPQNLYDEYFQ